MSEPFSNLNNAIRDKPLDCGLFDTLLPGEFVTVAGYFSISEIEKGETIFSEGDAGTFMCIIHLGSVSV
ncbi:cyclic nucleotide-binding domain-containing protein, partial [Pseudomonas syringae pv. tagetis]